MRVSSEFIAAVKLNPTPSYRIAQAADLDPSVLSKLLHGITKIQPNDERVIRVGKVLGLRADECFQEIIQQSNKEDLSDGDFINCG